MEELLNKLIEKGRKPFDMEATRIEYSGGPEFLLRHKGRNKNGGGWNVRNLVSKESGLWQFVCENEMIKNANDYSWELYNGEHGQYEVYKNGYEGGKRWEQVDYEYRIIQSALCDEDKLEQFLLDNIKVD